MAVARLRTVNLGPAGVVEKTAGAVTMPDTSNPQPLVSVIMGARNAEHTLEDALESIANQTYSNWELIACDDASNDSTLQILEDFAARQPTRRVVILHNPQRQMLAASLNRCLASAKGTYIARMDADDISDSRRLAEQVAFLESSPDLDLVGTAVKRFGPDGIGGIVKYTPHPDRWSLHHGSPFAHPTVLVRAEVYSALGGYTVSRRTERCEDWDLWFRFFAAGFRGANLSEPLYLFREDMAAIRRRTARHRVQAYRTTVAGYRMLGYPPHWYVRPTFRLFKALVPPQIYLYIRRLQGLVGSR